MPVFYTHRNREELNNKAKGIPEDILIPFNAGRQLTDRKRGLPGQFYSERPANLASLREWINTYGRPTIYSVAGIIQRDDIFNPNEGDIAVVADGDGLGNPVTFVYDGDTWVEMISGATTVSTGPFVYSPIPSTIVRATKAGITISEGAGLDVGKLTVTVPDTVELLKLDYYGDQSKLDANDDLTIIIDYDWDNGYNSDALTNFHPIITLYDKTLPNYNGGVVSEVYALKYIPVDLDKVNIIATSSNTLTIKITDLSAIATFGLSITL